MIRTASKLLPVLMALALCLGIATPAAVHAGETDVYFSPNGGGAAAVTKLIEAATDTIDVAMYSVHTYKSHRFEQGDTIDSVAAAWGMEPSKLRELNDLAPGVTPTQGTRLKVQAPIFAALDRAVARGVRVRVILHKGHLGSGKKKTSDLAGIGVHVFANPKTLHQKFALYDAGTDHARLSNGSANWSISADTTYSENTVVYQDHPELLWQFQQEFNLLLTQSNTKNLSPEAAQNRDPVTLPTPPKPAGLWNERAVFTSANIIQDVESENGVAADTIVEAIMSARHKIRIDVAHFDSVPIARAVIARTRNQQLDVDADGDGQLDVLPRIRDMQVLLDQGELSGWGGEARTAEAYGVDIRYKTYSLSYLQPKSQLMHHKTVIIDDELLITGSYNFSNTAEFKNFENTIVIRGAENADLIAAFNAEHDKLWNLGRAEDANGQSTYDRFLAAMRAPKGHALYKRILPIHYSSDYFDEKMTLTRAEVERYRSIVTALGIPAARNNDFFDRETRKPYRRAAGEDLGRFLEPTLSGANGIAQQFGN